MKERVELLMWIQMSCIGFAWRSWQRNVVLTKKISSILYLFPGKSLDEGLRKVYTDNEVRELIDIVMNSKVVELYVVYGTDNPEVIPLPLEGPSTQYTVPTNTSEKLKSNNL